MTFVSQDPFLESPVPNFESHSSSTATNSFATGFNPIPIAEVAQRSFAAQSFLSAPHNFQQISPPLQSFPWLSPPPLHSPLPQQLALSPEPLATTLIYPSYQLMVSLPHPLTPHNSPLASPNFALQQPAATSPLVTISDGEMTAELSLRCPRNTDESISPEDMPEEERQNEELVKFDEFSAQFEEAYTSFIQGQVVSPLALEEELLLENNHSDRLRIQQRNRIRIIFNSLVQPTAIYQQLAARVAKLESQINRSPMS
jgi:hypothetical protein